MGICCCKDNVLDMKVRQRKQRVKEIYKKYSKRKCYICDNIKYGKNHKFSQTSVFAIYGRIAKSHAWNMFLCIFQDLDF